ncbi:uncharacterized protein [Diadema antillarum]|uniref:uncharacterized protein n=1 Tax=Diadema antillarum TaxID=105358 RepID=UPI003A85B25A
MLLQVLFLHLTLLCLEAEELPRGHLEPFGGHQPPDVDIDELFEIPGPQVFWDKYVSVRRVAVLRQAATHSPGFTKWTEGNLKELYGDVEVRLEGKHERKSRIPLGEKGLGRDTLRSFLETFRDKDTYIVSQLPEPLYEDFHVPPCISCGNMRERIVEVDLWMSSGNTQSIIHKDAFNTINCLMKGTKLWKMIEPKYEKWLYKTWEPKREQGGNSQVEPDSVDLLKYPDIAKIRWSNITINAGDCLFIPKGYYHQVNSYGDPNMAVSILFARIGHFDDTGCNETRIDYTPLSDLDVLWSWPGTGVMTMGNMDVWMMQKSYLAFAEEKGKLTAEDLLKFMSNMMPEFEEEELEESVREAWLLIDKSGKGYLEAEDVSALDTDTMRQHSIALMGQEPSNTEDFEYFHISRDMIEYLLQRLIESSPDGLERKIFVANYVRYLGGSEEYGNEIFDGLAGKSVDMATVDEITQNMDAALLKWEESESAESTPEIDERFDGNHYVIRDEL